MRRQAMILLALASLMLGMATAPSAKAQSNSAASPPAPAEAPGQVPARAIAPATSTGAILVSSVAVDKHDSGETFVDISTSRNATYRVTTLPNPARVVVDIEGARTTCRQGHYAADTPVLKTVRVGQFHIDPFTVRVVADLNGNPVFDVHSTPAGLRIELRPRGLAKSAALTASTSPAPTAKPREIKAVTALAIVPPARPKAAPATMNPDVQSTLPASSNSAQAAVAPAVIPASYTPEALRAKLAAQILNPARMDSASAAQGTLSGNTVAPPVEANPVYTGEPISVNFKDVDIKDFFREIHEISGLNIIVDPNVSGTVTMVLDSVPWDQALDIVLKNNRLGRVMEGNVLRIAKLETLAAEQADQVKLADARINAAPLVTVFRPINYAKAQEIATILKTWAGGGALSRRGTVLVDTRNNTLIISDIQTQIPIILAVIAKIDKKAKQVSIEARIVLATADFTRTLSSSLAGGFTNRATTIANGATGSGSSISIPVPTTIGSGLLPTVTSTGAIGSGFGVASITNAGANYFINAAISAAEERDQAKTISRPTIVTQNNIMGMVQQGVQVPIQTSINNTITVQYENATLQMQVTPQVTDDNHIFMLINVNNASVGAVVSSAGPNINTQQATTSVLVPDGGTVVFGGITVTSRSKAATYIPLLGSIPILGNLFKTSNVSDQDQELLFFVTPKIIPG